MTEPIINDETHSDELFPPEHGRGLDLGLRGPGDFEYGDLATPFPDELLVPEHEWQPRIAEMEERKSRISDQIRAANLPHKDQSNTNYCWANAPVHCLEIVRLQQNQKRVILSPASVAAPITNFRNVGGWGRDALDGLRERGACPVGVWPANAIERQFDNEMNRKIAELYRVSEWTELIPRNRRQLISMLLRRVPVAVGFNWWGHEVTACDAVWLDGRVAIRIRNSWAGWGDFGFGILQGSKQDADDAVCPRTAIAA